jgi:cysteine desulfurase/selenocysteine lyase
VTRRDLGRFLAGVLMASGEGRASPRTPGLVGSWRRHFPTLEGSELGTRLVYLDSAATTQRPASVLEAMTEFYRHRNANPGKAQHTLARRAYEEYEVARGTVARFLHAAGPEEIVWARGTTESINLVASAWGDSTLRPGDEILLTLAEHASNLLPWKLAADRTGARLKFVDVEDDGRVSLEDLDRKLTSRTRIVAFSHISNVVGYVNPAAEICARARRAGALTLIDAAQSAPHVALDVQVLGCDFLAFSSHKMCGPMGVGVLWARRDLLEAMPPYQAGSNMAHGVDVDAMEFEHAAWKFGAGTPYAAGPIALATAIKFLDTLGREAIHAHEQLLTAYALGRLSEVPRLRILGPRQVQQRVPVFSFDLQGIAPDAVLRALDADGIAIRAGDLSALPLLKRLGVQRAARASCYLYTTEAEIDRLAVGLERLAQR